MTRPPVHQNLLPPQLLLLDLLLLLLLLALQATEQHPQQQLHLQSTRLEVGW
jgi:hypothetical protein